MAYNACPTDQPFLPTDEVATSDPSFEDPLSKVEQQHQELMEQAKATLKSGFPLSELLIHGIALGIIGVLLWVNLTGQYWQDFEGHDSRWRNMILKTWQLCAKLHELTMVASISLIAFYYMRKLLIGPNGVPFGLFGAPYTMNTPTMFLKPSFYVGFKSHWRFGILLVIGCLLSVILGPSSAMIMIPSLDWYNMDKTFLGNRSIIYYLNTKRELWPTVLNDSVEFYGCPTDPFEPTAGCPSAGFGDILKWFLSKAITATNTTPTTSDYSTITKREFAIDIIPGSSMNSGDHRPTEAYATILTELTSVSLDGFYNYIIRNNYGDVKNIALPELHFSSDSMTNQPIVHVACHNYVWSGDWDRHNISFPCIKSAWMDNHGTCESGPFTLPAESEVWNDLPDVKSRFSMLKDTRPNASSSLLALTIVPITHGNATVPKYQASGVVPCSIDARWAASIPQYRPTNSTLVSSNVSESLLSMLDSQNEDTFRSKYGISEQPLDIQLDWAEYLNGTHTVSDTGNSVNFTGINFFLWQMIEEGEFAEFSVTNITTRDKYGANEETISGLLSVVFADSLARSFFGEGPFVMGPSTPSEDTFISIHTYNGSYESDETITRANESVLPLSIELKRYGYGYAIRNKASRFAVFCLLLYSFGVCMHILYVLFAIMTRRYYGGTCWQNVEDLVALAMNSARKEALYETSVGIYKKETYASILTVQETSHGHLELCVAERNNEDVRRRMKVGKANR